MRAAPPVDAVLDPGMGARRLIAGLHALTGAVLAFWVTQLAEADEPVAVLAAVLVALLAMLGLGAWSARRALPVEPGRLAWDGRAWALQPDSLALAAVVVTLDADRWLLLWLQPSGSRPLWRLASARAAGPAWHGLRVALAAHAGRPTDQSAHAG